MSEHGSIDIDRSIRFDSLKNSQFVSLPLAVSPLILILLSSPTLTMTKESIHSICTSPEIIVNKRNQVSPEMEEDDHVRKKRNCWDGQIRQGEVPVSTDEKEWVLTRRNQDTREHTMIINGNLGNTSSIVDSLTHQVDNWSLTKISSSKSKNSRAALRCKEAKRNVMRAMLISNGN